MYYIWGVIYLKHHPLHSCCSIYTLYKCLWQCFHAKQFLSGRNNPHLLRNSAYCIFVRNFIWREFTYFVLLRNIPRKLLRKRHKKLVAFRYLIFHCAYSASIHKALQTIFSTHFPQQIFWYTLYPINT